MTFYSIDRAITRAKQLAKKYREERFIVLEDGGYEIASPYDMETFFLGANPLYVVFPDGSVER